MSNKSKKAAEGKEELENVNSETNAPTDPSTSAPSAPETGSTADTRAGAADVGTRNLNEPFSDELQDKPEATNEGVPTAIPVDRTPIVSKREITEHQVNGANEQLRVRVLDEPGAGGANHVYLVDGFTPQAGLPSDFASDGGSLLIAFQNGPIKEAGVNGITQEVLLAIVADRLTSFQAGPYACPENAEALIHVRYAQNVLQERTKARLARGVEGTHTV